MTNVFRLPNGVTCVVEERPGTEKVSMEVAIRGGSLYETPEENGLTFLSEHAIFGGTETRSRQEIAEYAASKGAVLDVTSGKSKVTYEALSFSKDVEDIFALLTEVIRKPAFPAAEIEKDKKKISWKIDKEEESPPTRAAKALLESAFANQMLGKPLVGSKELQASFAPGQVKKHHAELLSHPENIVISFCGDIDFTTANMLAIRHFADIPPSVTPFPSLEQSVFKGGEVREATDNEQLNILLGFPACGASDPGRHAFSLLEEIIDRPMSDEIREKRGLVYGVGPQYAAMDTTGIFLVQAGTGKGNAGTLIPLVFEVLGNVAKNGVSEDALAQAKKRILLKIKGGAEQAGIVCSRNNSNILQFGRPVSLEEYEEKLRTVTVDDVRRACVNMLSGGQYALSAFGPQDTMPSQPEIKQMMANAVDGVVLPQQQPAVPQLAKQFMQAAAAPPSVGAEPRMTVLSNGLKVVTLEREGNLTYGKWVGTGSNHESPNENGIRHIIEHMMFQGTPSHPPGTIFHFVEEKLGGGINAYTNKDETAYYLYDQEAENLDTVMNVCGEMVYQADLTEERFSGKRPDGSRGKAEIDVVLEEIKMRNDQVARRVLYAAYASAFPNQSIGRTTLGTPEALKGLVAENLKGVQRTFYVPNNTVIATVGPVKHEKNVALAQQKFGHFKEVDVPDFPEVQYVGGTAAPIEMDQAKLCSFMLGMEGAATTAADLPAYEALAELLGGDPSSRLQKELVDKQQLADSIQVQNAEHAKAGLFLVAGSTEPGNAKAAIAGIYNEIQKLARDLTDQELDKVKIQHEMAILMGFETNQEACFVLGRHVLAHGKPVTAADLVASVRNVTVDDVKRVALKIWASNPTLSMVVPRGTDPALLPTTHEEVVAMRDQGAKTPDSEPKPGFGAGPAP